MEAEQIKAAFLNYDRNLDGKITKEELIRVFKEISPELSDDQIGYIFASADVDEDGKINYSEFVDLVCGGDEKAAAAAKVEEYHDVDHLEDDAQLNQAIKEMEVEILKSLSDIIRNENTSAISWFLGKVTVDEFGLLLRHLGRSFAFAKKTFDAKSKQLGQRFGGSVHLAEFADELHFLRSSDDELMSLAHRIAKIRCVKKIVSHPGRVEEFLDKAVRDGAIDQLVRTLHQVSRPADDAWAVFCENPKGMLLSQNERNVLRKLAVHPEKLKEKVQSCMIIPPALPVSAGSLANWEACQDAVSAIIKSCRAAGTKFTDPDWDMTRYPKEVLYVDREGPGYDCTVAEPAGYKRLTEIFENPVLHLSSGDFKQGRIGTCFLLGAIGAVVAKDRDSLEKLFYSYDIELGVYGIKFCLDGEEFHVIVDDIMPVDDQGRLLYAKPAAGEEIWCPLLEKAYCKFNTCYEMCDGGWPSDAIFAFYGGDNGKFALTDEYRADPSSYFKLVKEAWEEGRLLTCTFKKQTGKSTIGKCGEAVQSTGLVSGHIYSIIKMVEAHGEQLICVRNPWGTGEWTGKWSDKNSEGEWTPEMAEAAGWTDRNDGTFFISIKDYVANACSIYWARTFGPEWKKTTQYGRFPSGNAKAIAGWAWEAKDDKELSFAAGDVINVTSMRSSWWRGFLEAGEDKSIKWFPGNYVKFEERPVSCFEFAGRPSKADVPMKVVVTLLQPTAQRKRCFYEKEGKHYKDTSYPQIQIIVVNQDGTAILNEKSKGRHVGGEFDLTVDSSWKIYAVCMEGSGPSFSLRCYTKGGKGALKELPDASTQDILQFL
eukprot:TRINITY_DN87936_c0_g1_i1.p1 TRINITY_DN87936_c0_g1~~TRINITY_DN87936_c0_g1_i1.p1  ORF type:complete len:848 (-),score=171.02 TRINITY_DN87936_c0_g1_i1:151-2616(-)